MNKPDWFDPDEPNTDEAIADYLKSRQGKAPVPEVIADLKWVVNKHGLHRVVVHLQGLLDEVIQSVPSERREETPIKRLSAVVSGLTTVQSASSGLKIYLRSGDETK